MILDTGTLFAIMIALAGSGTLILIFMRDNMELRKTINYLQKKEKNNG
jgi:hypothetical protein